MSIIVNGMTPGFDLGAVRPFMKRAAQAMSGLLSTVGIAAIAIAPAQAQTSTGGQSGTAEQELRRPTEPRSTAVPFRIERPNAAAGADSSQRFMVREVVVDGVRSLDMAQIRTVTDQVVGREVTLAELFAVADAITRLYAEAGYPLSFAIIPEQDVANGTVRLVVVEGTIDQVAVEVRGGNTPVGQEGLRRAVERQFASLVRTGPVRTEDLERALLLIQDWPGVQLSSVLRPSASVEGAADLLIVVDVDPLVVRLGLDNRLRDDFGTYRPGVGVNLNSFAMAGDQLSFDMRTSVKVRAFQQLYIRYEAPVGTSGARLFGSWSRAETEATKGLLGALDFAGEESVARVGGSYSILRSRAQNLSLSVEGARINSESSILGVTLIRDRVRTVEARLSYDWADALGGRSLVEGGILQGLSGLGATKRGNPLASRSAGTPDFTAVTLRAFHDMPLGANWSLSVDVDGQAMLSGSALAPVECSFGGDRFGRAYAPGAIGGDHCVRAAAEIKYQLDGAGFRLEPFAFGDVGAVRQKGLLDPDEVRSASAGSVGAGLRAALPFGLVAEAVAAVPLTKRFADGDDDIRFFFNLNFVL